MLKPLDIEKIKTDFYVKINTETNSVLISRKTPRLIYDDIATTKIIAFNRILEINMDYNNDIMKIVGYSVKTDILKDDLEITNEIKIKRVVDSKYQNNSFNYSRFRLYKKGDLKSSIFGMNKKYYDEDTLFIPEGVRFIFESAAEETILIYKPNIIIREEFSE